ncbi:MAG: hypothetical protein FJ296_11655, partial [Planctomycetes bacterium]|nr:hypothetical protein [Planctomycetota bacterium]
RTSPRGVLDLQVPPGADPVAVVLQLQATGLCEFAEVNALGRWLGIPNDPSFGQLWHLNNTGQSGGTPDADVDAPEAWDMTGGDPSVVIAVLDSGTEITHGDLSATVWVNPGEVPGNGVDDDGNGKIDDVNGWDFESNNNNPNGNYFHGTSVAGVVAARGNNALGIAGLAGGGSGGAGCRYLPVNCGSFAPITSVLDDAVSYVAGEGVRAITLSLQVPDTAAVTDALNAAHAAGVFIDCASGNSSGSITYPATLASVMAVGSTNHNDQKSSFSNFGSQLEVVAPGENIYMTTTGNSYASNSGTSFAAPHVGALAGLLFSANPALTNEQVRQILKDTADDLGAAGFDTQTGWGRINAAAAVAAAGGGALGSVATYGTGLMGGNGLVPVIANSGGTPSVGNASFALTLGRAGAGLPAFLPLSLGDASLPFKGGTLLVDPALLLVVTIATTSASGAAAIALPLPDDPLLAGLVFHAQWLVQDAGAVAGWALTPGAKVTVGS